MQGRGLTGHHDAPRCPDLGRGGRTGGSQLQAWRSERAGRGLGQGTRGERLAPRGGQPPHPHPLHKTWHPSLWQRMLRQRIAAVQALQEGCQLGEVGRGWGRLEVAEGRVGLGCGEAPRTPHGDQVHRASQWQGRILMVREVQGGARGRRDGGEGNEVGWGWRGYKNSTLQLIQTATVERERGELVERQGSGYNTQYRVQERRPRVGVADDYSTASTHTAATRVWTVANGDKWMGREQGGGSGGWGVGERQPSRQDLWSTLLHTPANGATLRPPPQFHTPSPQTHSHKALKRGVPNRARVVGGAGQ